MARTTPKGLFVWDLETDQYNHLQLATNWDTIDSLLGSPTTSIQTLSAVPSVGNFAGRLVMLNASDSGFTPWTLIRYDGSAWRAVGYEIQPSVPSTGNFSGRLVVLSSSSGGFNAWDVIRFDGSVWGIIGGWAAVNNGAGATNIVGLQSPGDVYVTNSARGFILADRATGTKYRLYFDTGTLAFEVVT